MKYIVILLICCFTMCSCATSRIPHHESRITIDTIYLSNIQYDSIYIYKDRSSDYRFDSQSRIPDHESLIAIDTIYIKDVSIEYRYKMLRDTVKVVQCDSIPYEVTIVETKEITRPLTWYDHLCRICFWLLIGFLFVQFWRLVSKLKLMRNS